MGNIMIALLHHVMYVTLGLVFSLQGMKMYHVL